MGLLGEISGYLGDMDCPKTVLRFRISTALKCLCGFVQVIAT